MPDFGKPYSSESERRSDREALLVYWFGIESLTSLADQPPSNWTKRQASLFPGSVEGGPPERPEQRLRRWLTLYTEEINLIRDVRNRLVHGEVVTDPELQAATWIARQILSTALGTQPSTVEPMWVRAILGDLLPIS